MKCQDTSKASLQLIAPFYVLYWKKYSTPIMCNYEIHAHAPGFITSCLESLLDSVIFPDQHYIAENKTGKATKAPVLSMPALPPWQNYRQTALLPKSSSCQKRVELKGSSCLPMTSYYLPRSRTKIYKTICRIVIQINLCLFKQAGTHKSDILSNYSK